MAVSPNVSPKSSPLSGIPAHLTPSLGRVRLLYYIVRRGGGCTTFPHFLRSDSLGGEGGGGRGIWNNEVGRKEGEREEGGRQRD